MSPDPSLRARLREALQQSAAGKPRPRDGAELPDERERDSRVRVDDEQARWVAQTLGGEWQHEGRGVSLVVDRYYSPGFRHGHDQVASYAEALERHHHWLLRFQGSAPECEPRVEDLLSDLDPPPPGGMPAEDADTEAGGARRESRSAASEPASDRHAMLFFDLETTGLSGGAGTCAFLVGYGWFDSRGFRTRQYFLSGYGHEAALLRLAARPLATGVVAEDVTLVSFNGKTFDVPLIQGRYLFHREASPFDDVPHVDLLHPARRLWRHRPAHDHIGNGGRESAIARYLRAADLREEFLRKVRAPRDQEPFDDDAERMGAWRGSTQRGARLDLSASAASCALGVLERAILGFERVGDVPGADIPSRYFHYARTGDVRPLASVLEHNRLDLLSLAALASVVARLLEHGAEAARNAHECLALGRIYERSGAADRATACYERAVAGNDVPAWRGDRAVECQALRHLAIAHRRCGRYHEAMQAWQRLLDLAGQGPIAFEALHALAVHHEHRSRDLTAARAVVVRALNATTNPHEIEALRYRLARIERKMASSSAGL